MDISGMDAYLDEGGNLSHTNARDLLAYAGKLEEMVRRLTDADMGPVKWSRVISDAKQLLSK